MKKSEDFWGYHYERWINDLCAKHVKMAWDVIDGNEDFLRKGKVIPKTGNGITNSAIECFVACMKVCSKGVMEQLCELIYEQTKEYCE